MVHDIRNPTSQITQPSTQIRTQEFGDQIPSYWIHMGWKVYFAREDLFVDAQRRICVETRVTAEHFEEQDTKSLFINMISGRLNDCRDRIYPIIGCFSMSRRLDLCFR